MRCVDLFSGCGGLSLGFTQAGHTIVSAFDNWDEAINVYRANFRHPDIKMDLSDVETATNAIMPLQPQMIIGGPPCQDFSSAGDRNEDKGRGDLTVDYAQIVANVRPEWFVMENVSRITKTQKLVEAKKIFKKAGYGLTQTVLDASRCGVPQKRKRFILIGKLGEQDGFMEECLNKNLSDHDMTVAEALGDKIDIQYYYRHPRSYVRRGIFSVNEPSPTIRGVNRPLPQGYQLHPNDPVKNLDGIRPLTTHERSLIQTFPDDFVFLGSKTDQEQMIGNAVPVKLGKYVGECILEYIKANEAADWEQIKQQYPDEVVNHEEDSITDIDTKKNVLISLVKADNMEQYLDQSAKIYYTGKKFPSTVALNKLYYFMPYVKEHGIRDLYLIKIARVGTRKEGQPDNNPNDFRLVFEIEFVKELFSKYKKVHLDIWQTFKDTTLSEILSK